MDEMQTFVMAAGNLRGWKTPWSLRCVWGPWKQKDHFFCGRAKRSENQDDLKLKQKADGRSVVASLEHAVQIFKNC